jgi:hypothetical protein
MRGFPLLAHDPVEGTLHRSDEVDWLHGHDAKCQWSFP